jgi:hypothetical protein
MCNFTGKEANGITRLFKNTRVKADFKIKNNTKQFTL